eukprot:993447-Amorphochlora_amoeboformis.AAC.1
MSRVDCLSIQEFELRIETFLSSRHVASSRDRHILFAKKGKASNSPRVIIGARSTRPNSDIHQMAGQ